MTKRTADSQQDPLRGLVSFKDPLGVRVVDPTGGDTFERLVLCAELAPLETPLRDRVARLVNFRHVRFPRVRGFEAHGTAGDRVATITFDRTHGVRLSEVLRPIEKAELTLDVNAALQVARETLPALAVLHDSRAVAHGAIALERMILTPNGRIVLVEHVLAAAIERLQYPRTRLWREFRIAVPPSAGLPRFDARSDVAQVALAVFTLLLGRPLALKEFPDGLKELLQSANERLANGSARPMTAALRGWLERALPIESRKPFTSALDAQVALEDVVKASHAYAPAASSLKVIHDRYVAWEGAQRARGEPEAGHADTKGAGPTGHPSSPALRRGVRRQSLRVVHQQQDEEADEIRHLEAELERIRKEEALADAQAVGAESVPVASTPSVSGVAPDTDVATPSDDQAPTAPSEQAGEEQRGEPDDDVLTIDLDALVDEAEPAAQPAGESSGRPADNLDPANPAWQVRPPEDVSGHPAPEPAPEPVSGRDEPAAEPAVSAEPEPDAPSLGRLLAAASSAAPPLLPTAVVKRLAEGARERRGRHVTRHGRRRRPGAEGVRAALPAQATPVTAQVAVPAAGAVEQAIQIAPALRLAPAPSSIDQIVKPDAPALAVQATPVVAGLAVPAAAGALEQAAKTVAAIEIVRQPVTEQEILPAPAPALAARATPVAAGLAARAEATALERAAASARPLGLTARAAPGDETLRAVVPALSSEATPVAAALVALGEASALDVAVRDVAPLHLVAGSDTIDRLLGRAEPCGDAAVEEEEAASAIVANACAAAVEVAAPEEITAAADGADIAGAAFAEPDDIFIDAEAFELADGVVAVPLPGAPTVEPAVGASVETDAAAAEPLEPEPVVVAVEAIVAPEPEPIVVAVEADAVATEPVGAASAEDDVRAWDPASAGLFEAVVAAAPVEPEAAAAAPLEPEIVVAVEADAAPEPEPVVGASVEADAVATEPAVAASAEGDVRPWDPAPTGLSEVVVAAAPVEPEAAAAAPLEPEPIVVASIDADTAAPEPEPVVVAVEADAAPEPEPVVVASVEADAVATEPAVAAPAEGDVRPWDPASAGLPEAVVAAAPVEPEAAAAEPLAPEAAVAAPVVPDLVPPAVDGAVRSRDSRRRRKLRRTTDRSLPTPAAAPSPATHVPDLVEAASPALLAPPPAASQPATSAAAAEVDACRDGVAGAVSAGRGEPAGVDEAPTVQAVAPWLRGRLVETQPVAPDDEDVNRPAIVNFDAEETDRPDTPATGNSSVPSRVETVATSGWNEPEPAVRPAARKVVPFAPAAPADVPARGRPRHEPPAAESIPPVKVDRPRIDWRRTAAASLLMVLIEGAAFGAAYWYVKPRELGVLNVRTSLPGIEVVVDGRPSGRTPASLELTPGRHSLELRGAGVTKVLPVEISAGVQTTQSIQWPRSSRVGRLQVKSTPSGARVMIGYEVKGTTPVVIENLAVGSHEVVVEGDAGSVRSTVKVRADQTAELNVGIYSGWLAVFAPVEVRIFEGGKMIGTTLDGRLMMRPGTHTLELRNPSLGFNETRKVEITPGRVTALSLQAPTGTIKVDAPAGTEIVIDGEAKGVAPADGIPAAVGTREVVLRHPQLGQRRFVVTVGAKVPAQVSFMSPP